MGLRGPKPSPTVLKLISGNPGKRPLNLSDGINPPIQVPAAPKWLSTHAAKEWRRIGGELAQLGLIAEIDKASLATYCQTWGELSELEMAFAAQKRTAMVDLGKSEAVTMEVFFQKTPTGFLRESALHRKIVEMRGELDRYVRNFGLNPSARSRVTASNNAQIDLPGMEVAPTVATGFARFTQL